MESSFDFANVGGLDLDFDFDPDLFDVDLTIDELEVKRYQKPVEGRTQAVAYKNAHQLAREIELYKGFRAFVMVPGCFIFGDFIEAISELDKIRIERMTIHTLTMSQDSIDSLANVIAMDHPTQLQIIMSDYWYAHEHDKRTGLLWELYDKLDIGDGFRLAFCRTHAKVITILTKAGHKLVIHGSANMRSSGVIEQFVFEHDPDLYDFCEAYNDAILDRYDTINHGAGKLMRKTVLWPDAHRQAERRMGVRHVQGEGNQ